jgi:hypothetical protein
MYTIFSVVQQTEETLCHDVFLVAALSIMKQVPRYRADNCINKTNRLIVFFNFSKFACQNPKYQHPELIS